MKKLALALAMITTLVGSQVISTPKAEAGVLTILGAASDLPYDPAAAVGGIALGTLVTWGGFAIANTMDAGWHVVGIVLIVMDANQEFKTDGMKAFFAKK